MKKNTMDKVSVLMLVLSWVVVLALGTIDGLYCTGGEASLIEEEVEIPAYIASVQVVLGVLQLVVFAWLIFLIVYPLIKYKSINSNKKQEIQKSEEYKTNKKELKAILFGNLVFVILIYTPMYLNSILVTLAKPVIYIYPEIETTVQVSVGYPEKLSCVYPEYDMEEDWEVIAKPNGDLVDTKTGRNLKSICH